MMPKKTKDKTVKLKNPHVYVDGDMLVYTIGYASEKKGVFADGAEYKEADLPLCKSLIRRQIENYLRLFNASDYTLVLSGSGNWRTEFYKQYKANRVTLVKPLCYNEIRSWMAEQLPCIVIDGEEADDWLAAKMTGPDKNIVVVTADKDFFTVPGSFYHLSSKRLFNANLHQTFCFLFFQALSGDRVDGYYGVKWVGKAKVQRLLKACHGKSIRQAYLFIKKEILRRGKTTEEKKSNWADFRTCLSLAALRWDGETGDYAIGIKRVFRSRRESFEYFLPYYEVAHNARYGEVMEDLY